MNTFLNVFNTLKIIIAQIFNFLHIPEREHPKGRKPTLTNSEAVTVAVLKQKQNVVTKKSLFEILEPPCEYNTFVRAINGVAKYLARIVTVLLQLAVHGDTHLIKFTDWTDIPVCLVKNAKHHKTMRELSGWSKNGKGWFYGLKLHLSGDLNGSVLALRLTRAGCDDRQVFKKMNEKLRGLFVADAGYLSEQLTQDFFIEGERVLVTGVRGNMKKMATRAHIALLNLRMRVEIHFRVLKLCHGLITSFPRSIDGYLTHYLAAVCAYLLA